jgi:hypothetical protein
MGRPKIIVKRVCVICSVTETKWSWHRGFIGWLCHRCYVRTVLNPIWNKKRTPEISKKYNSRQLTFKGKQVYLKENPRKGVCSICNSKVGEGIKNTSMHHIQYHPEDPLKDTIELCTSCHNKQHKKDLSNRVCRICKSNKTYTWKDKQAWYKLNDGYLCQRCYKKSVNNVIL